MQHEASQRPILNLPVRTDRCVGDALDAAADTYGDEEAWIFGDERVSYEGMRSRANAAARSLLALGLGKGDVVATWTPNLSEWAVLQMACAKIGALLAPLNTRFKQTEMQFVLDHSEAQVLVHVPSFVGIDFREILADVMPDWADGEPGSAAFPRLRTLVEIGSDVPGHALSWEAFLGKGSGATDEQVAETQRQQVPTDPLMLQYTSGTTAFPKGALLCHTYVLNFGLPTWTRQGVQPGEAVLNTQPFYHSGGACGAVPLPLTLQCRVVTPEYYEAERVMELIEREGCVARTGFAAMYLMEIAHPRFEEFDISSLRAGWCAGAPEVIERVRDALGIDGFIQIYGATEGGGTCGSIDDSWEKRIGSHGKPFEGTEVRIIEPDTQQELPTGETGEIWTRGWYQMNGYLKQPDETAQIQKPDGWIGSGDLGYLDEDGFLHFVGRLKDMLKPGGENVSAEEVEAYLLRHPGIEQVAVIGAPDARLGEVVLAVVEPRKGHELTDEDVIGFCRGKIANYKVPRHVRFTDDWPLTGSGKIQKFVLRERYLRDFQV